MFATTIDARELHAPLTRLHEAGRGGFRRFRPDRSKQI